MTETGLSSTIIPTTSSSYYFRKLHSHPYKTREELHKTFGGRIYNSDFSDNRGKDNDNGSSIACRIESDARWEKKLIAGKGINYDW